MDISLEKARNRSLVIKIFRGRCALNMAHRGAHVHEIVPKSLKYDWWVLGNQVLLCPECHDKIHREGTRHYIDRLTVIIWTKLLEELNFLELIKMIVS